MNLRLDTHVLNVKKIKDIFTPFNERPLETGTETSKTYKFCVFLIF